MNSSSKTRKPGSHSVYVIELSKSVYTEDRKFREANPQYNGVLECLYVGMTSKDPKVRFKQHMLKQKSKRGYNLSSRIVAKYGLYLRPSLFSHINPLTRKEATETEEKLALKLKQKGYAVWWN